MRCYQSSFPSEHCRVGSKEPFVLMYQSSFACQFSGLMTTTKIIYHTAIELCLGHFASYRCFEVSDFFPGFHFLELNNLLKRKVLIYYFHKTFIYAYCVGWIDGFANSDKKYMRLSSARMKIGKTNFARNATVVVTTISLCFFFVKYKYLRNQQYFYV